MVKEQMEEFRLRNSFPPLEGLREVFLVEITLAGEESEQSANQNLSEF